MESVCPSITGTRVQVAETTKGAGTTETAPPLLTSAPRILLDSDSTFGSSLRM
jgi:hypothetical protein